MTAHSFRSCKCSLSDETDPQCSGMLSGASDESLRGAKKSGSLLQSIWEMEKYSCVTWTNALLSCVSSSESIMNFINQVLTRQAKVAVSCDEMHMRSSVWMTCSSLSDEIDPQCSGMLSGASDESLRGAKKSGSLLQSIWEMEKYSCVTWTNALLSCVSSSESIMNFINQVLTRQAKVAVSCDEMHMRSSVWMTCSSLSDEIDPQCSGMLSGASDESLRGAKKSGSLLQSIWEMEKYSCVTWTNALLSCVSSSESIMNFINQVLTRQAKVAVSCDEMHMRSSVWMTCSSLSDEIDPQCSGMLSGASDESLRGAKKSGSLLQSI